MRRLASILVVLLLVMVPVAPADAHETVKVVQLSSSDYTNGTWKSFTYSGSHSVCGGGTDVYVRVYYDRLDDTKMRVRKIKTWYYISIDSTKIFGGYGSTVDKNGYSYWPGNDFWTGYYFDSANAWNGWSRAKSVSGATSYTHYGSDWVYAKNGKAWFTKETTHLVGACSSVDHSGAELRWP